MLPIKFPGIIPREVIYKMFASGEYSIFNSFAFMWIIESEPFLLPSFFDKKVFSGNVFIKDRAFSSSPIDNFLSEFVTFVPSMFIKFYGFLYL